MATAATDAIHENGESIGKHPVLHVSVDGDTDIGTGECYLVGRVQDVFRRYEIKKDCF